MSLSLLLLAALLGGQGAPPVAKLRAAESPAAELRAVQARYAGKDVWVYGGGPLRCYTASGFADIRGPFTAPVRVVGVQRQPGVTLKARRVLLDQRIENALILRLRPSVPFEKTSWGVGANAAALRPLEGPNCREFLVPFAGPADLERTFSLTPPDAATKAALHPFPQADPLRPPTFKGLTHRQVLWLRGVPDEPVGSLKTLLAAPEWRWLGPPGRGDNVLRFEGDRVVGVEEPSWGP